MSLVLFFRQLTSVAMENHKIYVSTLLFATLMEEHIYSFAREPWKPGSAGKVLSYIVYNHEQIKISADDVRVISYVLTLFSREPIEELMPKVERLFLQRFPECIASLTEENFIEGKAKLMGTFASLIPSVLRQFDSTYTYVTAEQGKAILAETTLAQFRTFALACLQDG